eukprot:10131475-Alexandrium_andersonii.AAC.1
MVIICLPFLPRDSESFLRWVAEGLGFSQGKMGIAIHVFTAVYTAPWPVSYTHLTLPTICSV